MSHTDIHQWLLLSCWEAAPSSCCWRWCLWQGASGSLDPEWKSQKKKTLASRYLVTHFQSPMARRRPGSQFQKKYLARSPPVSEDRIFLPSTVHSRLFLPDMRHGDLETCLPVQLLNFDQPLRHPEIAVTLESTFLGILGVFDGDLLKVPNFSARHSRSEPL